MNKFIFQNPDVSNFEQQPPTRKLDWEAYKRLPKKLPFDEIQVLGAAAATKFLALLNNPDIIFADQMVAEGLTAGFLVLYPQGSPTYIHLDLLTEEIAHKIYEKNAGEFTKMAKKISLQEDFSLLFVRCTDFLNRLEIILYKYGNSEAKSFRNTQIDSIKSSVNDKCWAHVGKILLQNTTQVSQTKAIFDFLNSRIPSQIKGKAIQAIRDYNDFIQILETPSSIDKNIDHGLKEQNLKEFTGNEQEIKETVEFIKEWGIFTPQDIKITPFAGIDFSSYGIFFRLEKPTDIHFQIKLKSLYVDKFILLNFNLDLTKDIESMLNINNQFLDVSNYLTPAQIQKIIYFCTHTIRQKLSVNLGIQNDDTEIEEVQEKVFENAKNSGVEMPEKVKKQKKSASEIWLFNQMINKLSTLSSSRVCFIVNAILNGWVRSNGSHMMFRGRTGNVVPVENHGKNMIGRKTLVSIVRGLGLSTEEIMERVS